MSIDIIDEEEKKGNVVEILPRKNALVRPAVANVDQALVIFAGTSPKPNLNLLDRFLLMMEQQNVPTLICFNKEDLASEAEIQELRDAYGTCGYPLFFVSARQQGSTGRKNNYCGRTFWCGKIYADQSAGAGGTDGDRGDQ